MQFQDGHNLVAIEFEAGWRADKPILFAFGGHGTFVGKHIELHSGSGAARELGRGMSEAIAADNFELAAQLLANSVPECLKCIRDSYAQAQIRPHLIRALA
jgi:hypothetical protein